MNNVKKNFHTKSMLRHMADGGVVRNDGQFNGPMRAVDAMAEGRDPNEDRRAKAAEYGMAPKKNPEPNIFEKAKAKADEIRAKLGFSEGGHVQGPGGPTEDKIPAMLSDGEFVLPADTVDHIGVGNLRELVAQTHKPTGKSPLRGQSGLRHMADGDLVGRFIPDIEAAGPRRPSRLDPLEEHKLRVQARLQNPSGAARTAPVAQPGPYPPAGPEGVEISRAEFDAARARQAGRVSPDIPRSAPNTLGIDAARAARAARYGEQAGSKLGGLINGAKAGIASKVGSALRLGGGTLAAGVEGYRVLNSDDPIAELPRAGGRLAGAYAGARVGAMAPGGARIPGALIGGAVGYAGGERLVDDLTRSNTMTGNPITHDVGVVPNAMDIADHERNMRTAGADPVGMHLVTPDSGGPIPEDQRVLPPIASHPVPGSNASFLDTQGRPTFDNNSLLRMQARSGQPAVTDQHAPQAQQADPIEGALRNLLRQQGGGVGMINSREGAINNQFDALQKQIVDTYGGKAQGTMISKLLDLQKARADALGQDQGARVNSQGNVVAADNSVRGQQSSALDNMASMRNSDRTNQTSLLREQLEGIRAADTATRSQAKDNVEALTADALARHTDPTTGKPDVAAAQAEVDSMLQNAPGLVSGTLSPGDSRRATGEYAGERALRDVANQGSSKANDELLNFGPGSALRHPLFGEVTDPNSDVTLGDFAYDKLVDFLPGMPEGVIAQSSDGRVVRNRKLDENQRRALLRKLNKEK